MKRSGAKRIAAVLATAGVLGGVGLAYAQQEQRGATSYAPIDITEPFASIEARMKAAKADIEKKHADVLAERYDLADRPAEGATMSRGKPLQAGVRVKLPAGTTWAQLAGVTPADIRDKGLFPKGFYPLPHPNHPEGGMVFPKFEINEVQKQEGRDLTRFDLDFDIPDHFLPEFPAPIYLTTRPDLGDVSQGKLVTIENYYELFNGILNPKQLEGLRLLVTPFPQQQFNQTEDRRSEKPSRGVTCFDCHQNGHTIAAKKGVNILERGSQVHDMAELQEMLDFPPAPKLDVYGKLNPAKATPAELRGQAVFFGKGQCVACHAPPYYTDNSMHNLQMERFYKPVMINGMFAAADGPIKTFPLRGVKDSPPYLHDGRLLTLEDTVEFFDLVLGTKLTAPEKQDLVQFLRALAPV